MLACSMADAFAMSASIGTVQGGGVEQAIKPNVTALAANTPGLA
jgi:hypothetical protein